MHEQATVYIILEDIRSIHNVGAIFRTADAAGVTQIFLCGVTPGPIDRFGRVVSALQKTALGAETTVSYRKEESAVSTVQELRSAGVQVWAVEQTATAANMMCAVFQRTQATAFVFGNEVAGVSEAVLQEVDGVFYLPMWGSKESLNVSVATGITLYLYRTLLQQASVE